MEAQTAIPLPTVPAVSDLYRDPTRLAKLNAEFNRDEFVKLPSFLTDSIFELVVRNLEGVYLDRIRRDFIMPGFHTERRMSIVGGSNLARRCLPLVALYGNMELRAIISKIIGGQMFTVRHREEFMVANFLDGAADTHGWHTDDPQYALIVIIESPGNNGGGELEYIPRWRDFCAEFDLDPNVNTDEGVALARSIGRVWSTGLLAGDCYLLNANQALHRVTPMMGNGRRKALNMAFDNRQYREFGDTAEILYGT